MDNHRTIGVVRITRSPDHPITANGVARGKRMTTYLQKLFQQATTWLYQSRRRLAIGGVGLLACFIGYHAMFGANGFLVYQDKKAESRKLQHELEVIQQDIAQRQDRIKALTNDPQTIEKEAREKRKFAREGDVIYILPPAKPAPPPKK